jgi:hypothetical protein
VIWAAMMRLASYLRTESQALSESLRIYVELDNIFGSSGFAVGILSSYNTFKEIFTVLVTLIRLVRLQLLFMHMSVSVLSFILTYI